MNIDRRTLIGAVVIIAVVAGAAVFLMFGLSPLPSAEGNIDAVNHYNKGVDLANIGLFEDALAETDKALAINQNFIPAWVQKAGLLNVLGRYDEAIAATDKALALKPNSSEAWTNRADALNNLGRYSEALDASNRALAIDPGLAEAEMSRNYAEMMLAASNSSTVENSTRAK
jgi:tetratricopeptide (TPR) repeat protein